MTTSKLRVLFQPLESAAGQCLLLFGGATCLVRAMYTDNGPLGVVGGAMFLTAILIRSRQERASAHCHCVCQDIGLIDSGPRFNSTTGMPMIPGTFVDVSGKPYGHPREL